ncbi:MAG: hypothetical protein KBF28_14205 [Gemmatimonadales bacterium]|nr:hypothetical protein [Gemmatimonadales bacterium]
MALARATSSAVELLGRAQPGERVQREVGLDLQAANGAGRGVCEVCEEAGAFPAVVVLRPIPQDRETMAEDPAPWRVCEACRSSWRRSDLSRSDWRAERVERLRLTEVVRVVPAVVVGQGLPRRPRVGGHRAE